MANHNERVQRLLEIVEKASRKKGLELNNKKYEVMGVSQNDEDTEINIFTNE